MKEKVKKELKKGDILSETSHYIVSDVTDNKVTVKHFESGQNGITLEKGYVQKFIDSSSDFTECIKVGKEDKFWTKKQIDQEFNKMGLCNPMIEEKEKPRVGDLKAKGIRSIWESIYSSQVFTVCFKKKDEKKSIKVYQAEIDRQINDFCERIEIVKESKKGVADASKTLIEYLSKNPILDYIEGEERILKGFKIEFTSKDGFYKCMDMKLEPSEKENCIRDVNINTIKWLIYDGVKYIVE